MPFKGLATRTVGYEREGVQPVGVEGAYNAVLSGKPGQRYEKDLREVFGCQLQIEMKLSLKMDVMSIPRSM